MSKIKNFPDAKQVKGPDSKSNEHAPLWIDVATNTYPVPGERVLITVQHKSVPGLGSMQVGRYSLTGKWKVDPPYVRYDDLTDGNGNFTNGKVTHWARASEEVLKSWDNQNDIIGNWAILELRVNRTHEEDVYKGLTLASSYIRSIFESVQMQGQTVPRGQLEEMVAVMNILLDLRNSIKIEEDPEGFVDQVAEEPEPVEPSTIAEVSEEEMVESTEE